MTRIEELEREVERREAARLRAEVERLRDFLAEDHRELVVYAEEVERLRAIAVDALALLWADEWTPEDRDAIQERLNATT